MLFLLVPLPLYHIQLDQVDIFIDDWLVDGKELALELAVVLVGLLYSGGDFVDLRVHFLLIEIWVIFLEHIIHDLVLHVHSF